MAEFIRWTVRNVSPDTVEMIAQVAEISDFCFGELLNQAVEFWYDALPEEDDDVSPLDVS